MKRINGQNIALAAMVAGVALLIVIVCISGINLWGGKYAVINDGISVTGPDNSTTTSQSAARETVSGGFSQSQYINANNPSADLDGFDAEFHAKRLYELKYLFAVDRFNSVSELSVSAVVQFAFCHLYYDSLIDMPKEKSMLFRQVLPESITGEIRNLFGENNIDIKKSDLYNAEKKVFEMWQPQYNTPVYADVRCEKRGAGVYELTATFYKSSKKDKINSVVSGIFKKQNDKFILASMKTVWEVNTFSDKILSK